MYISGPQNSTTRKSYQDPPKIPFVELKVFFLLVSICVSRTRVADVSGKIFGSTAVVELCFP